MIYINWYLNCKRYSSPSCHIYCSWALEYSWSFWGTVRGHRTVYRIPSTMNYSCRARTSAAVSSTLVDSWYRHSLCSNHSTAQRIQDRPCILTFQIWGRRTVSLCLSLSLSYRPRSNQSQLCKINIFHSGSCTCWDDSNRSLLCMVSILCLRILRRQPGTEC